MSVKAYAAQSKGALLTPFEYEPGPLGADEVDIEVHYCGLCHSDISMIDNDWGSTKYPLVPGHEVVGRIRETGSAVRNLKPGQMVGVGWNSGSCETCSQCLSGHHNLCPKGESTIVSRHGGFADRVRCHELWAIPLPDELDPATVGPLFCGGITVFGPIVQHGVKPTDRVGVIGIGGLGHMALKFLRHWGCEVTAFTSSSNKRDDAMAMGAHRVVNTSDADALPGLAGTYDFILSTVNVSLDWDLYISLLAPRGHLHFVGAVLEPVPVSVFSLLGGDKTIGASPLGSPATVQQMLEFSARHGIEPITELFPMSKVNEAIKHLKDGKARYRVVLEAGR